MLPTGDAAIAEAQLRTAADPVAVEDLDRALRTMAANAAATDTVLPQVRAALLTGQAIELYLVDETATLPAPFSDAGEGTWVASREHIEDAFMSAEEAAEYAPPFPALVSIGGVLEDGGHLLLNLEALGSLGLVGEPEVCHEVMSAMAIEIVTAAWSDSARVTLIGVLPELVEVMGSDRATYTPDIEEALPALQHMAADYRAAHEAARAESTLDARGRGVLDPMWSPHIVLVSGYLTETDQQALREVVEDIPRIAVAAITTGAPVGEWTLEVAHAEGGTVRGVLTPSGMDLLAHHLPMEAYYSIVNAITPENPVIPGPAWTEGLRGQVPALDDIPQPDLDTDTDDRDDEFVEDETPTDAFATITPNDDVDDIQAAHITTDTTSQGGVEEVETVTSDPVEEGEVRAPMVTDSAQEHALAQTGVDSAPPVAAAADSDVVEVDAEEPSATTRTGSHAAPATPVPAADDLNSAKQEQAPVIPLPMTGHPRIRLLGPVEVIGAQGPRPASPRVATEVLAYLALCPGRNEEAFTEALQPVRGGKPTKQSSVRSRRNQLMSAVRAWLGTSRAGEPLVPHVDSGQPAYGPLHEDVIVDWVVWSDLVGDQIGKTETGSLIQALRLVHGMPLSGVSDSRWAWAQAHKTEMCSAVSDVAHEVASRCLNDGDARTALWAAEKGLQAESVSEALWRAAITAAAAMGDRERVQEIIDRCQHALDDYGDELEDETLQLIDEVDQRHTASARA